MELSNFAKGAFMKQKHVGMILAATVGALFATASIANGDDTSSTATVKCVGGNACKGQSACQTASNACKGQNKCKGTGYVMTATAEECTAKGGKVEE